MKPEWGLALARTFELAVAVDDDMERGLAELGLTRARAGVLVRLHAAGPMNQRELSGLLDVTPRNVTTLVDALVGLGFVERRPSESDRRASIVALTDAGSELASRLAVAGGELAGRIFADVPSADLAAFVRTVEHVIARLQAEGK